MNNPNINDDPIVFRRWDQRISFGHKIYTKTLVYKLKICDSFNDSQAFAYTANTYRKLFYSKNPNSNENHNMYFNDIDMY